MGARKKKVEAALPARDTELLAAICAAPNDDAPRLVYADHLLESADERERQRGEFIIAQCSVERLPKRSEEWRRARARELSLQRSVAEKPKNQHWGVFEWERGLPRGVGCPPKPLRKAWKELARLPIDRLALYANHKHREEVTLGDIAWAVRQLPQLEKVLIAGHRCSATLATKYLDGLDAESTHVAMLRDWPRRELHDAITAFTLDGDGPGHMEERFPRLTEVSLRSPGPYTRTWLAGLLLERLALHHDGDARLFGQAVASLRTFPILERLNVNVRLGRELSSAIATSSLEELTLSHDATDAALAEFVAPPSLRRLTLFFSGGAWHNCTPESVRYRLAPAEYRVESLELGRFIIDASFDALSFPNLYELRLVECIIDAHGIAALTKLDGLYRPEFLRCIIADPDALRERWPDVVMTEARSLAV